MANEIELKLTLAAADQRRFLRHPLLKTAAAKSDAILDNTYFDTPELALRHHGVALRLRRQGRERLQTIKLATKAAREGGLSIRPEWETPYSGAFDFSVVEAASVRQWLEQPHVAQAIGPLFRTRFRRLTWHFPLAGGGEVLVALDRGEVIVGERRSAISEVELELADSTEIGALHRLAGELATRVPLEPSSLSKAQRGYDLLARVTKAQ